MTDWAERAIASVRDGNPDPEAIWRAYRGPMKQAAARKLGADHEQTLGCSADDVVGNVIADLYERKVKIRAEMADLLRPYLRGIVANYANALIRQRMSDTAAGVRNLALELTDIATDVETMVLAEQVQAKMHLLNERERYVVIENVIKSRPVKDVADELQCAPQNISQLRRPALRKLFPEGAFVKTGPNDQTLTETNEGEEEPA
jgi:DNA-directed RNA polymerase specialized sigma24 family protein